MAELVDDFGDPDRNSRAEWLARLAHLMPLALIAQLVMGALQWFQVWRPEEWAWFLRVLLLLPLLLVVFVAIFHVGFARLCVRCMESVPADAPTRAQTTRKRFWLRLSHIAQRLWGFLPLALILIYDAAVGLTLHLLGVQPFQADWAYAPADIFIAAFTWSIWVHHRYRPWCPWCRRWDDGGGIREPSPDPVGSGDKVVT